ncbi:SLC13 family permease [Agromyces seonyuensis]|uniref:TRAP transporter large permease subunit n=1 Tax=Agromyces seonyuensis TaxID=2662446 RepID=A0A6I4P6Q8_9MICO|nr:SLC13 family permease [Agromyces seonyuensis]MWB99357.1 TRAP transporter large permease subunit [Agromyces seonyuensis]
MDPVVATFVILGLAVIAFAAGVNVVIASLGVAVALWATGVLTLDQALAGFGDPTVMFIATLFVVSEALDATGVTTWIAERVVGSAGTGRRRLILVVSSIAALLTAFISVNGAVAALVPVVVVVATQAGIPTSKLLMPIAFAAHAGSLLLLTGTPVNIIVSDLAVQGGGTAFGFFEFALAGLPLTIVVIAYLVWLGPKLAPLRTPESAPPALGDLAPTIRRQYELSTDTSQLLLRDRGVVEAVVPPRSPLIGTQLLPGMTTPRYGLVVLAAQRGDVPLTEQERLRAGDVLVLSGDWSALRRKAASSELLIVDDPEFVRRTVPLGRGSRRTLVIAGVMVVLLATGIVPPAIAGLLAAGAVVITRVLTVPETFRAIQWTTVVLIAGMLPMATAFLDTGAAELLGNAILDLTGPERPWLVLAVLSVATLILGQFVSNSAAVLVLAPVAIAVATQTGTNIQTYMMALTVAAAAAFFTPVATPANLMIQEPGGYRFGDYWKLGLVPALLFLATAVFWVPFVWPLSG